MRLRSGLGPGEPPGRAFNALSSLWGLYRLTDPPLPSGNYGEITAQTLAAAAGQDSPGFGFGGFAAPAMWSENTAINIARELK